MDLVLATENVTEFLTLDEELQDIDEPSDRRALFREHVGSLWANVVVARYTTDLCWVNGMCLWVITHSVVLQQLTDALEADTLLHFVLCVDMAVLTK